MTLEKIPLFLGLLSGVLFAVSFQQYQSYSNPTPAAAVFSEYASGGTSFYFISLRGETDGHQLEDANRDGAQETADDAFQVRRTVDDDEKEEINRVMHEESNIPSRMKRDLESFALDVELEKDFDPLHYADILKSKARILCMVTVERVYASQYAKSVQESWLKHCDGKLVMSNVQMSGVRSVSPNVKDGAKYTWSRTRLSLMEAHDKFLNEYDWFLKVPHDGFAVLENMRYLVFKHQARLPSYMGHVFKGPNGGGAVIVLSRDALKLIRPHLSSCSPGYFGGADDADVLETCFSGLDVIASMNGRDASGKYHSQMRVPRLSLPYGATGRKQWNWKDIIYPEQQEPECCKEYTVAFHHVQPHEMYLLEYMVYHMRPFGIGHYTCSAGSAVT